MVMSWSVRISISDAMLTLLVRSSFLHLDSAIKVDKMSRHEDVKRSLVTSIAFRQLALKKSHSIPTS